MAISDGIIISLVGIGVVFSGLLLTSWLISAISLVPVWLERRRQIASPPPVAVVKETMAPVIWPVPPADTAAVIAALLEVEMRLHGGDRLSRFTFRRDPSLATWRDETGTSPIPPIRGAR
ncbi:MAG: OadG family protein [Candidatus Aminicenantes bacterium]|nr:OadG family protein [Candidatus Aminicenantes bacterium]